jgi:hypothetical protein
MRYTEEEFGAVDNSCSNIFPPHLISRINRHFTLYTSCYVTQYDDDPDCFRRIISYLQLKDLLGAKAPDYVSHALQHLALAHCVFWCCDSQSVICDSHCYTLWVLLCSIVIAEVSYVTAIV